jgi:hypothetical protein
MSGYRVADIAALKAIGESDRGNNDLLWVVAEGGWYSFNASSTAAEDLPLIVAPNAGTGRWFDETISPRRQQIITSRMVFRPITLVDGTTVTANAANGNAFFLQCDTGRATRFFANPTNPIDNQQLVIRIFQSASGNNQITWGGKIKFPIGSSNTLVTTVGASALVVMTYSSAADIWQASLANYS